MPTTTPEIDALIAQVANTSGVIDSTIVFLTGLIPILESVAGNRAATLAVTSTIQAKTQALADAVAAEPAPE